MPLGSRHGFDPSGDVFGIDRQRALHGARFVLSGLLEMANAGAASQWPAKESVLGFLVVVVITSGGHGIQPS